jgi:hypothetical protein
MHHDIDVTIDERVQIVSATRLVNVKGVDGAQSLDDSPTQRPRGPGDDDRRQTRARRATSRVFAQRGCVE